MNRYYMYNLGDVNADIERITIGDAAVATHMLAFMIQGVFSNKESP